MKNSSGIGCGLGCWMIAALGGLTVFGLLLLLADFTFMQGAFFGLLTFVLGGLFMVWAFCGVLAPPGTPLAVTEPRPAAARPAAMAHVAVAPAAAAPVAAPVDAAPMAEAVPLVAAPARAVAADGKPPMLAAARGGQPDDLKIIRGIGPKLEIMLHGMGIYHFDQIADWQAAELAWVDDNLEGFKGRASRDHWVVQARVLAAGGTEAQAFAAADAAGATG